MSSFERFNLTKQLNRVIDDLGFEQPTPIQNEAYPVIMSGKDAVGISLDETTSQNDVLDILHVFAALNNSDTAVAHFDADSLLDNIPSALTRTSDFMTHPLFNTHRSESEMMRYIKKLQNYNFYFRM